MNERSPAPEHEPFEDERLSRDDVEKFERRPLEYDVLLANLKDEQPEHYEALLVAAERDSVDIRDKQAFVHGFLYNYGLTSEPKRAAFLKQLFEESGIMLSDGDGDVSLPPSA